MKQMLSLGICTKWIGISHTILSQQYHGDVTVVPTLQFSDYLSLFTNPSPAFVRECTKRGEKALWPSKLFRIYFRFVFD